MYGDGIGDGKANSGAKLAAAEDGTMLTQVRAKRAKTNANQEDGV